MDKTIKTVKLRTFSDGSDNAKSNAPQSNLTEDQNNILELAKKNAQLEEEKKKSLEQTKIIEQLREILKQEQAKAAEMAKKMAGLEVKVKELAELETKVKELTELLDKISSIATAGRAD